MGTNSRANCYPKQKARAQGLANLLKELVGAAGFEPATPWPPAKCATRLRHAPSCPGPVHPIAGVGSIYRRSKAQANPSAASLPGVAQHVPEHHQLVEHRLERGLLIAGDAVAGRDRGLALTVAQQALRALDGIALGIKKAVYPA